jgi:hypothetical protein
LLIEGALMKNEFDISEILKQSVAEIFTATEYMVTPVFEESFQLF